MSVEKEKVLAAIELKFKGKSITKTFKESIATKWAAKIDNDTEIDAYIEDREDVILEAVSEADRRSTSAVETFKKKFIENPDDDKQPKPEDKKPELPSDTPDWAKALMTQVSALSEKQSAFEKQQNTKTLSERFKSDERIKNIPDFILSKFVPASDEEFEQSVTDLQGHYATFAKEANLSNFGNDKPDHKGGGQGKGDVKQATKEEIDEITKGLI